MDALGKSIRKFNPGTLQSDDEIRAQFVVRQHELDIVLEVLRGNIESPSCQHVLIVAPRGRGKTMLLARVAAELHTDAASPSVCYQSSSWKRARRFLRWPTSGSKLCSTSPGRAKRTIPSSRGSCERRTPTWPVGGVSRC